MWPLWMIVAVAVGGAVSLTVTAVLTVVYFERRRHRRLMAQHGLTRNPSQMHRHHLSITDVDIASLPRAAKSFRHSHQRPRSESIRFYANIPSQDEIRTFPEGTITDSVVNESHYQDVDSTYQWLAPSKSRRFKRKKKIAKVSTSHPARSPMSAITEATESSRIGTPEPVELPAHITPEMTPERADISTSIKIVQDSRVSIDSVLGKSSSVGFPQGTSHGTVVKSRSISMGSIAPPPSIPLPPIPDTMPFDQQRRASLSRSKSDISLYRRDVSSLSQSNLSRPQDTVFSGFRFELAGEDMSRKNSSRAISSAKHSQSSFRFPNPVGVVQEPGGTLKTIDASTWNLPNSLHSSRPITPTISPNHSDSGSRSVSMIDYDAIFSAGSSLNNSPTKSYDGPLSRPVSALSVSSADMFRLSVIGSKVPESPRAIGHKRQNCVRIKNLTPIDTKKRLSSQLGRLAEAEEDNESILLPSPARVDKNPSTSSSVPVRTGDNRDSSNNDTSFTVPVIRQPQALSLRVKRPGWVSIKDKNKQARSLPVPGDPVKQSQTSTLPTGRVNGPASHMAGTEIAPTVLEAIKTSGTDVSISPLSSSDTYILSSPQRRRTQIQGPRNAPPPSLRVRNQTIMGSPLRRKSSENERVNKQYHQRQRDQEANDGDLRKSILMLKTMTLPETLEVQFVESPPTMPVARTPSSGYVDSPSIRVPKIRRRSNTVAGHTGERVRSRPSSPTQPNGGQLSVQTSTPTAAKLTYSPSIISIWEDASIKGDSPEPPSAQSQRHRQQSTEDNPGAGRYSPVKSHRDHFDQLSTYSRNISSQQYQQLGQQPQIQRESLWKLQQNADVITTRALALSSEKSPSRKRVVSTQAKLQGMSQGVPKASPQSTTPTPNRGERTRSHTVSAAARPVAQTACEGIGLGLKFGEKSMAYTVNEMDNGGFGRLR